MNYPGNYNVSLTLPTARTDGSALAATDIAHLSVYRASNGGSAVLLGTVLPTASPLVYVDTAVPVGTYVYTATATDVQGDTSAASAADTLTVVAKPAAPDAPVIAGITPA